MVTKIVYTINFDIVQNRFNLQVNVWNCQSDDSLLTMSMFVKANFDNPFGFSCWAEYVWDFLIRKWSEHDERDYILKTGQKTISNLNYISLNWETVMQIIGIARHFNVIQLKK